MLLMISRSIRSPTSATPCSAYQTRRASRSTSAASAKRAPTFGMRLFQAESRFGLGERQITSSLEIRQAGHHRSHECPLLLCHLAVGNRLNDGDAATAAGQQHRTMSLCRMLDHPARIDLQVGERNNILGEFDAPMAGLLRVINGSDISTCLSYPLRWCIEG